MARKHRRRTRKRNKKGGFVGPEFSKKFGKGVRDLDEMRKKGQAGLTNFATGAQSSLEEVQRGYSDRVRTGGLLPKPPQPPSSYVNPETGMVRDVPLPPPMEPTKEKEAGGLLGLGWFGLGGRRLSHSAFINKMLRVRNKSKRNKAIRKYLKGGKKTKRKGRKKKGGRNDTCRAYYEKNTLGNPDLQFDDSLTQDEANNYCQAISKSGCLYHTGECFTGDRTEAMEAAVERQFSRMLAESGGRRRKRKNKTKKRRRRR